MQTPRAPPAELAGEFQGILCSLMTWHENKKLFVEINQAAKLFLPSALLGFDTQALVLGHSAHLGTATYALHQNKGQKLKMCKYCQLKRWVCFKA